MVKSVSQKTIKMATNNVRTQVLSLYKSLLRESEKIEAYNFRMYAIRRVQDAFKENKGLEDIDLLAKQFEFAKKNLGVIKRQALIGNLYSSDKLVIEAEIK